MRTPIKPSLRMAVFARDGFTCQYCGRSAPEIVLHVDHVVPISEGGGNEAANLITSCKDCNLGKGRRHLDHLAVATGHQSIWPPLMDGANYQFEVLVPEDDSDTATMRVSNKNSPPGRWVKVTKEEMRHAVGHDVLLLQLYEAKGGFDDLMMNFMIQFDLSDGDIAVLDRASSIDFARRQYPKTYMDMIAPLTNDECERLQRVVKAVENGGR